MVDLIALAQALERHADRRPLLALQLANNETGVIQDIAALGVILILIALYATWW